MKRIRPTPQEVASLVAALRTARPAEALTVAALARAIMAELACSRPTAYRAVRDAFAARVIRED
jgi:hypothetical protein